VALPTRLKFKELPQDILRKRDAGGTARMDPGRRVNEDFIVSVLERWRGATMSHNLKFDESGPDLDVPVRDEVAPLQPAPPGLDPNRFKILKRPTEGRADVFSTPRDASKPPLRSPPR
jgi:hypothetical protein